MNDWTEKRRPERQDLAGQPSPKLLRSVRQTLWLYVRCRPGRDDRTWKLTWEWAYQIATRTSHYGINPKAKRLRWPTPAEIASQYLILALAEMRDSSMLRLPHNAGKFMPAAAAALLVKPELTPRIESRFAAISDGTA